MHWQYKTTTIPHSLAELKALLLEQRGITTADEQNAFFHPLHPDQITPEMVGLDPESIKAAVGRILRARDLKEEVVIFGDYDADGVCSTAILWEALRAIGIVAKPFLPHREKHGYGLSLRSINAVLEEYKPKLLITVDNGIVAHDAFAKLAELKIDTILTDHHTPETTTINGKESPKYPPAQIRVHTTQLCGSTVAWMLARALSPESAHASLELAAIATVADQMPLLGAHRSFVVHGITELKKTERVGLRTLLEKAKVDLQSIDTGTLNYSIVPRINAMGRLKHSLDALRLVCTTSQERANQLVEELNTTNTTRQDLTTDMIDHAIENAAQWKDKHIIIVADSSYHEGVIGLLASKLVETYFKPAVVIALGEKVAKASCRSIPGVHITDLLRQVRDEMLEVGGHPMAAGFAALPENIPSIKKRLEKLAHDQITEDQLQPKLLIDCELPAELVNLKTVDALQEFAPFGQANLEPIFSIPPTKVSGVSIVGKDGKHLKIEILLEGADGKLQNIAWMGWGKGKLISELHPGDSLQLAGTLCVNEWKNRRSLQGVMKAIRTLA